MNATRKQANPAEFASSEAWNEFNKSALDTATRLAEIAFMTAERLLRLQLENQKDNFSTAFDTVEAAQQIKNPKDVEAFRQQFSLPPADRAIEYGEQLMGIMGDTQKELARALEVQREEFNQHFTSLLENISRNAPSGSDTWIEGLRSAMASSSAWVDNMQRASEQWRHATEANLKAATDMAQKAMKTGK